MSTSRVPFRFLFCAFLCIASTCLSQAADEKEEPRRPNVILIMADDLGWGDVGFNGSKQIKTPQLDRMAAAGATMTRFYAAAPVCSPTRGSCLTGRHPFRYGIYFANTGHMKTEELTLAELLKKRGYTTGHFGKWHLGTLTKTVRDANRGGPGGVKHFSPPAESGFDVCFSTESKVPTWDPMVRPEKASKSYWNALGEEDKRVAYGTRYWNQAGNEVKDNLAGDDSRVIMDRAIPFIQKAAADGDPFFSVIWFHTPHLPVVAGPRHAAMYPDAKDDFHRNYYGCITAMDEQIGRLRDELEKLGIAKDTLVSFCSDNGPEGSAKSPGSAGKFRGRKRSLYEGGVRVPGIVVWPAEIEAGTVSDFPASTSDYLPTILGAIGAKFPDPRPTDGIDLLPALRGEMKEREQPIGFQSKGMATLSAQRYKLVDLGKKGVELYDLLEDPYEKNDLAKQKPDTVSAMKKQLKDWRASCKRSDEEADYEKKSAAKKPKPKPKPMLRFGAIADCQYADADTRGKRHYRLAAKKLEQAVTELNKDSGLDFVIHLGDFIDRDFASFATVSPIYAKLKAKSYHLLGNHDYEVADDLKSKVPAALGLDQRYYDFSTGGWRFIVLDGNEFSTLPYAKDSPEWKEAEAFRTSKKPPLAGYCGAIKQEQIDWLEGRLDEARKSGERAIIFCHYPLTPEGHHNLWNDQEMMAILKGQNDVVKAWINGHNHAGAYELRDGIHYLTLKGMLDTKENSFATIEVFDDKIEVDGHYREPDRTLRIKK